MGAYDHQGISAIAERRRTRPVRVGGVQVGGGAPVSVQSMTTTDTTDVQGTLSQDPGARRGRCRHRAAGGA